MNKHEEYSNNKEPVKEKGIHHDNKWWPDDTWKQLPIVNTS